MARYINEKDVYNLFPNSGIERLHVAQIDVLPRADVVEAVHARWEKIHDDPRINKYLCTNCKAEKMRDNYCPNCGAKMDGGRKE